MSEEPVYTEEEMDALQAKLRDAETKVEEYAEKIEELKEAIAKVASEADTGGLRDTLDAIADAENLANKTRT